MRTLQRDFDLLAFSLAAHEHANESTYQAHSLAPRIMPLAHCHQNFEQMQAHMRDRLVRQVVADSLNRIIAVLDKMHFFLHLVQNKQNATSVRPEIQTAIKEKQHQFVEAGLAQKFDFLDVCFDIRSPFTDFVLALELTIDALVHHRGCIQEQHLNVGASLMLPLKKVSVALNSANKLADEQLVFEKGEAVDLGMNHLQQILITVSIFADHLFRSVASYTQAHVDG